jgi:hypothetical protein
MDEEDLIFEIQDAPDVNWDEVSAIRKLPEFIMEEFSDQLNWLTILLNRQMTKKTINRFRKQLTIVVKGERFFDNLTDDRHLIMFIALEVCPELFKDLFNYVCSHNLINLVRVLLKDPRISAYSIGHSFVDACKNNHFATVEVLLKDPRVSVDSINGGFRSACCVKHCATTVEVLLKDPRVSRDSINGGFRSACCVKHCATTVEVLLKDPRVSRDAFNFGIAYARQNGRKAIVKILRKDPRASAL